MIRVALPFHLRTLAKVDGEVEFDLPAPVTIDAIVTAVEERYPMLKGTIRDHTTKKRRDFLRFFACQEDWSHDLTDKPLPEEIASGKEPFLIVGAMAGG